jgi:splicing factor 3A subunit 2
MYCRVCLNILFLFVQKVETWDKRYQYLLFAAEPYEIIGFKIPSTEIDKSADKFFSYWDPDKKEYLLQLYFKPRPPEANKPPPAPPGTLPNGTGGPGAPPRPPGQVPPPPPQVPPPPHAPPPAPMGMPPRIPPPPIGSAQPPPPPPPANGPPRPMIPPPPNFTPGAPPPRPPM